MGCFGVYGGNRMKFIYVKVFVVVIVVLGVLLLFIIFYVKSFSGCLLFSYSS